MNEVEIANGCAKAPAGTWLTAVNQPVAVSGECRLSALKGFLVPDRSFLRTAQAAGEIYCSSSDHPFLSRIDVPPDENVAVVSKKMLIAPASSRVGAKNIRPIPMSFRYATIVTEFRSGWAVTATRGRVSRVALEDGSVLSVRPEALVAWIGKNPTGFIRRLRAVDFFVPRLPGGLVFNFYGPGVVWFEGAAAPAEMVRKLRASF